MSPTVRASSPPAVAILPWGDIFEDFLDAIGTSLDAFCTEMTGGWLFGYVEALQMAGMQPVVIIFSDKVSSPERRTHLPTGATISILPAPQRFLIARAALGSAESWRQRLPTGRRTDRGLAAALAGADQVAHYLSTPVRLLMSELREFGCRALICQEYEDARFALCVLAGRWAKLPVFATFQGGRSTRGPLGRAVRAWLIRSSAGLIVASQREANRLQQAYGVPSSSLAHIFNPLNLDLWPTTPRLAAREALSLAPHAQIVVWHGRISIHHKGLDVLLDAWEQLTTAQPDRDLRLLLVGTGQDAEEFARRLAARRLPGILWLDEYLHDRGRIQQYLSAGDVYVFPSRYEGFPVAPLEAMACSLPVVATDVQGIRDIFAGGEQSGGIVVPPENPEQVALALARLLDDEQLRSDLGRRAHSRVEEAFSLETVSRQLSTLLRDQMH